MSRWALQTELASLAGQALIGERRAETILELLTDAAVDQAARRAAMAVELAGYDLRLAHLALSRALAELQRAEVDEGIVSTREGEPCPDGSRGEA